MGFFLTQITILRHLRDFFNQITILSTYGIFLTRLPFFGTYGIFYNQIYHSLVLTGFFITKFAILWCTYI